MDVKEFEDSRWKREDQKLEWRHRAALEMISAGTILDLGCGDGLLLSLLAGRGARGKGLDLSDQGVSKAKAKGLDAEVFDFAGKLLPFPDGSFDTVVMLDVLEHLYDPESLLKEARRVSKREVIIGVPNFNSLPARLQTLAGRVPENNQPKKGHVYWFNLPVLKSICRRAGLRVLKIDSNTIYQSAPGLSFFTGLLKNIFPNLFSLSFVVLVRK